MNDLAVSSLLALPSELIHQILSHLGLSDILSTGLVSRVLYQHTLEDALWQPIVQAQIPASTIPKPVNLTWRELFKQHHPYWFLVKKKVWFADTSHTGKLLIARYDYRINVIEAYALVAERRPPTLQIWDYNPDAIMHTFSPHVQLDFNAPVIRLDSHAYEQAIGFNGFRLQKEIPMNVFDGAPQSSTGLHSHLMLTRPWLSKDISPVWPPRTIPSMERTRIDLSSSAYMHHSEKPVVLHDLSESTFRIRKWLQFSSRPNDVSMRIGEDIATWATLSEECYTPTKQKPWQGIWCGDYAGHGCEFLVIMQPDNPDPLPRQAEWALRTRENEGNADSAIYWTAAPHYPPLSFDDHESDDDDEPQTASEFEDDIVSQEEASDSQHFDTAMPSVQYDKEHPDIYTGRLEAVKLTGDPNIPRGEYTFIAPDLGSKGLLRVATENAFKGARVVRCVGHVAAGGFRDDSYMISQLILISHNRLAQYWEAFGHVSFYERVDIDALTML